MDRFTDALEQRNLEELRKYPKADLHNHFVLGGNRRFLYQVTGKKIEPLDHPLTSMDEMDRWSQKYIGQDFNSTEMRKLLIRATFQQAREDGVTVLEIGEDVWGLNEFFNNDIDELDGIAAVRLFFDALEHLDACAGGRCVCARAFANHLCGAPAFFGSRLGRPLIGNFLQADPDGFYGYRIAVRSGYGAAVFELNFIGALLQRVQLAIFAHE